MSVLGCKLGKVALMNTIWFKIPRVGKPLGGYNSGAVGVAPASWIASVILAESTIL